MPEETNTTFDNAYLSGEKLYEFYNYQIWNKRFADVIAVEEAIKGLIISFDLCWSIYHGKERIIPNEI